MSGQLSDLLEAQTVLVARYRGVGAEEAARVAGVPVGFLRRARAALGRCPETGDRLQAVDPSEDPGFDELERLMRSNRSAL